MVQTMRVSKPGYNALTETDIFNYSIYADSDNILIKEFVRGSGISNQDDPTVEINHNLGYIPFYLVYTETAVANRFRIANAYAPNSDMWLVHTDDNILYVKNTQVSDDLDFKYFIFYDNMD